MAAKIEYKPLVRPLASYKNMDSIGSLILKHGSWEAFRFSEPKEGLIWSENGKRKTAYLTDVWVALYESGKYHSSKMVAYKGGFPECDKKIAQDLLDAALK